MTSTGYIRLARLAIAYAIIALCVATVWFTLMDPPAHDSALKIVFGLLVGVSAAGDASDLHAGRK